MKSEPDAFSIDDLKRKKQEPWDGVRNYQARNFMRDGMRPGDKVFFYHSNCAVPGIVGIAEVAIGCLPRPQPVRSEKQVLRSRQLARQSALDAGRREVRAQAQAHDQPGRTQGP